MTTTSFANLLTKLSSSFALFAFLASPLMAEPAKCDKNSCTDEIGRIYVTSDKGKPRVYVDIEDRSLAAKKLNCKVVSGRYFTLKGDHPAFEQIFELLVETKKGKTENKRNRITIRLRENSPICEIVYVYVEWLNP